MNFLRALGRALYFVSCAIKDLSIIIWHRITKGPDQNHALRIRKRCLQRLLHKLGVKVHRKGHPPQTQGPFLFVANHRSYLDPIVILADVLALPVSKAEVAHWPLIGFAAKQTGILFVKREKKSSRKNTLLAIKNMLRQGHSILIHPEGTTLKVGSKTAPFRLGAFRLAAELDIPVIPIALEYHFPQDAWVGDATFIPHFFQCFGKKHTPIQLSYGPALHSKQAEELLNKAKKWIDQELEQFKLAKARKTDTVPNSKK